jgi:hypothetical protein
MGLLCPQPHLLMQIVVKQDQVEVSLQALQRPLPDPVLATASLRKGRQEVKEGLLRLPLSMTGKAGVKPGKSQK